MDARDLGGLATGDREEEMGEKADSKGERCGQAGSPHSWGLWEHRALTPYSAPGTKPSAATSRESSFMCQDE